MCLPAVPAAEPRLRFLAGEVAANLELVSQRDPRRAAARRLMTGEVRALFLVFALFSCSCPDCRLFGDATPHSVQRCAFLLAPTRLD